jgi:hypothetical protein
MAAGVNVAAVRAVCTPRDFPVSNEDLEVSFGEIADAFLAKKGLTIDAASRPVLLNEIRRAILDGAKQVSRKGSGDYGPDPNVSRFPQWAAENPSAVALTDLTSQELFSRWEGQQTKTANTVRRYAASWRSFIRFMGNRDVRTLEDKDVYAWAVHRRDVDGVKAPVVNKNDLVAVSSVFRWAASLNGGRIFKGNSVRASSLKSLAWTRSASGRFAPMKSQRSFMLQSMRSRTNATRP